LSPSGIKFSKPILTGPGAHPASYANGTGSIPVVNWQDCDVEHPPHLTLRLKREQNYTSTLYLGFCVKSMVKFTLTYTLKCHNYMPSGCCRQLEF